MDKNEIIELNNKVDAIYREILPNCYKIGCDNPRDINEEDVQFFSQAFTKLMELKREYSKMSNKRKALGNEISALSYKLVLLAEYIYDEVRSNRDCYRSSKELFVNDIGKIISILFRAQDSLDFSFKTVYVTGIASLETQHATRETQEIRGLSYLIGDANILAELEEKIYSEEELREINTRLLDSGKSFVIGSNYYFDTNLLPHGRNPFLEIKGPNSIYCCLKEDDLKIVVNQFLTYAMENGNHINDIPEEEILRHISIISPKNKKEVKDNLLLFVFI